MSKTLGWIGLLLLPCVAQAATYTVINTADAGVGSLRWAINQANGNAGADTIDFGIGSGAKTIALVSALPPIAQAVTIDATTQPGFAGTPLIEINGAGIVAAGASGITVSANSVVIKGLVINRFNLHGILINAGSGTTVTQCYIGTDAAGATVLANGHTGVYMANTGGHVIGPGNVISGNAVDGVRLDAAGAANSVVKGNKIGTNAAGDWALANAFNGVVMTNGAHNNVIGGTTGADLNVISGNSKNGVAIASGSTANVVERNYIGLAADGATALGNGLDGVFLTDAPGNKIGGDIAGTFNIIGTNLHYGIEVSGAAAGGNTIQRNIIGSDLFGNLSRGNNFDGVAINAPNTVVGGGPWGSGGNLICNNNDGVSVSGANATGALIQGNRFGLNAAGTVLMKNGRYDVDVYPGSNATIGVPGAGNVLAGATYGSINIEDSSGNLVQSNYIGTDASGNVSSGQFSYISISYNSSNNVVGGANANQRNIIAGVNGIVVSNDSQSSGNRIEGNWIGIAANGTALGNANGGVQVYGPFTTVRNNVISNDGVGIYASGANLVIAGNLIGTDPTGTAAMGNSSEGIRVSYANNVVIGGSAAADRNIISANGGAGIDLENGDHETRYVYGNYIGTDISGAAGLGNVGAGVHVSGSIFGSGNNVIGGTGGQSNVISANGGSGIHLDNQYDLGDVISGNRIGTKADGVTPLGNAAHGIFIAASAGNNSIGGTAAGQGNIIRSNGLDGVYVAASSGNDILGNSIYGNGGLGIDLGADGVTANDAGDGDTGANDLQNFPALSAAYNDGGGTLHINGSLNATPNLQHRIEFFVSSACDPSGYGEGATLVTALNVTTDANGNAGFAATVPGSSVGAGAYLSATATSNGGSGETSEFSACRQVVGQPAQPSVANNGPICQGQTLGLSAGTIGGASYAWTGPNGFASSLQNPSILNATTAASGSYTVVATVDGAPSSPSATTATVNACTLSIADAGVIEGDTGTTPANFSVTLDHASTQALSVQWATADGTAAAPGDYAGSSGTLTFNANETSKTIAVNVVGDTLVEGNETFKVNLSSASAGTIGRAQATGTISDDDTAGSVQFRSATYSVGESAGSAKITVARSGGSASGVSVNYATANGTAIAGSDYTPTSGTLTFGANETSKTFSVPILNDSIAESTESLNLTLSSPAGGATLGAQATATLTIADDDAPNGEFDMSECTADISELVAQIQLSVERRNGSNGAVSVHYATADGSAKKGSDYVAKTGTLNWASGDFTPQTISVSLINNPAVEPTEQFSVVLSQPTGGAAIGGSTTTTVVILDNPDYVFRDSFEAPGSCASSP